MAEIPVTYNGFKGGMDNVQPDFALKPSVLRDAVNVDIFDDGNLRRRRGATRVVDLPGCHSLFSDGDITLFVAQQTLKQLLPGNQVVDLAPVSGQPLACLALNGTIYYSDGVVTGRVTNGVARPWGVEKPNGQPVATALPQGGLPRGTYQVAVTYVDDQGTESGTGLASQVTLSDGGGIQLSAMPQPVTPQVQTVRVYVSSADGSILYRTNDLPVGVPTLTVTASTTLGHDLKTQFLDAVPAGTQLAYHKGRIYIAAGNVLWYTEALRYGLSNLSGNFIPFAAPIRLLAAVPDGLFVATDKTYFLSDVATAQMTQVEVLPYTGVPGTVVHLPQEEKVAWFSERGPVIGSSNGQVSAPAQTRLAAGSAERGAAFIRESDSVRQLVAMTHSPDRNTLAAASYMDADIVRKENL